MTHEEWVKLTPEQQRIKVAELCGWRRCNTTLPALWQYDRVVHQMDEGLWCTGYENGSGDWLMRDETIPDYLNDLNAMHEAGKMLKLGMRSLYDANLGLIAERDYCFIWETTAAQRAEAFLKTLGLWEAAK